MTNDGTIVAISSTVAPSARLIVRTSGSQSHELARRLCEQLPLRPGAARVRLRFDGLEAPSWIYVFAAPRSATGEDVVEYHLPGNVVLARLLVRWLQSQGARPAEPGEFTARAFLGGKLDLAEAEGVAAVIAAHSDRELRAARQLLSGELSRRLRPVMDALAETLALVEVGIDFSDEDVTLLSARQLRERLSGLRASLDVLLRESVRFERLAHEPRVALVGRPNAGKSTLLNRLAGVERAVVSEVAGTTRDALSARVMLRRGMVTLVDLAGLEHEPFETAAVDPVRQLEQSMRETSLREAGLADVLVLLREHGDDRPAPDLPRPPDLVVLTKVDVRQPRAFDVIVRVDSEVDRPRARDVVMTSQADVRQSPASEVDVRNEADVHRSRDVIVGSGADVHRSRGSDVLCISALTGEGIDSLVERLDAACFGPTVGGGELLALTARHVQAVELARAALARADTLADGSPELLALEMRESLDQLGSILGMVSPDELLGRVFSRFCIGK